MRLIIYMQGWDARSLRDTGIPAVLPIIYHLYWFSVFATYFNYKIQDNSSIQIATK